MTGSIEELQSRIRALQEELGLEMATQTPLARMDRWSFALGLVGQFCGCGCGGLDGRAGYDYAIPNARQTLVFE